MSRIVPVFEPGTAISVLRAEAHWLVTEYGARNLRGMTLRSAPMRSSRLPTRIFERNSASAARERHLLA